MEDMISEINQNILIPILYQSSLEKHLQFIFTFLSNDTAFIPLFTFQSSLSMPSVLSRRLYSTMNKKKDNKLSKEEFIEGFMTVYCGSIEERIKFLFDLLSFNKATINNKDIIILLNNIVVYCFHKKYNILETEKIVKELYDSNETNSTEIDYDSFLKYLLLNDCGLFYIFYTFLFNAKNFSIDYLNFLLTKIDDTKVDKNVLNCFSKAISMYGSQKDFSSFSTNQSTSLFPKNNSSKMSNSFKGKILDTSLDFSKLPINQQSHSSICFTKLSKNASELLVKINCNSTYMYLLDDNNNDELISIESGSSENNIIDPIDTENLDLLELNAFESDFVSTKSALNLTSPTKMESVIFKQFSSEMPYLTKDLTPSCNSFSFSNKSPCSEDLSVIYVKEKKGKRKEIKSKLKIFDHVLVLYQEDNTLTTIIPMKGLFPCQIKEITKTRVNDTKYYTVDIVSVLFPQERYTDFSLMFKHRKQANSFIESIEKSNNIRDYKKLYTICDLIGEGHFGKVYTAKAKEDSSNKLYAIKIIKRDLMNMNNLEIINNEIEISKTILSYSSNSHLIHCYDVIERKDEVAFVMEYITTGKITSSLKERYSVEKVDGYLSQIIEGIQYLHSFGLVHRDIKPDNLLISENNVVKIIDFGLSKIILFSEEINENYGSLLFTAPEILLNEHYNTKVDVWSIGVIAFYLLFGILPFSVNESDEMNEIALKIVNQNMFFPYKRIDRNKSDIKIRKFISIALNKKSKERPFINDILYNN